LLAGVFVTAQFVRGLLIVYHCLFKTVELLTARQNKRVIIGDQPGLGKKYQNIYLKVSINLMCRAN
jgi:hypothetical protein